jgi:hypothetical protein
MQAEVLAAGRSYIVSELQLFVQYVFEKEHLSDIIQRHLKPFRKEKHVF